MAGLDQNSQDAIARQNHAHTGTLQTTSGNYTVDCAAPSPILFVGDSGFVGACRDNAVNGAAASAVLFVGGVGVSGGDNVGDGERVHYRDERVREEVRTNKSW